MSARDTRRITFATRGAGGQPVERADFAIGADLSERYRIGEQLGAGAMGAVYAAEQVATGRTVAIKFLLATEDAEAIARFVREGRMLAKLSHPAVLRVFDVGDEEGHRYLVTDLLTGGTLRERLEDGGPLPVTDAVTLAVRLLEGLAECHRAGIVHRDLKPENVMFDERGDPVIVDLGIGRLAAEHTCVTRTGALLGTPLYMSPEQWQGDDAGPPADLYALAAMLFEMIAGRRPFEGGSLLELLDQHCKAKPPRLDEVARVPGALARAVARGLEKEPAARHESATAMAEALRAAMTSASGPTTAPRPPAPRALRAPAAATARGRGGAFAVLLALTLAGAAAMFALRPAPPPPSPEPSPSPSVAPPTPPRPPRVTRRPQGVHVDEARPLPAGALFRVGDGWLQHEWAVTLSLADDAALLASADRQGGLVVWDLKRRTRALQIQVSREIRQVSLCRGGRALAMLCGPATSGTSDRHAEVQMMFWEIGKGPPEAVGAPLADPYGIVLDGRIAAVPVLEANPPRVAVMDLESGAEHVVTLLPDTRARAVSADGRRLVLEGPRGLVVMEVATAKVVHMVPRVDFDDGDWTCQAIAISPDGGALARARGSTIELIDLVGRRTIFRDHAYKRSSPAKRTTPVTQVVTARIDRLSFSRDGRTLFVHGDARLESAGKVSPGERVSAVVPLRGAISGDGTTEAWLTGDEISVGTRDGPAVHARSVGRAVGAGANLLCVQEGDQLAMVDLDRGTARRVPWPTAGCAVSADESVVVGWSDPRLTVVEAAGGPVREVTVPPSRHMPATLIDASPAQLAVASDGRKVLLRTLGGYRIARTDGMLVADFEIPYTLRPAFDPSLQWVGLELPRGPSLERTDLFVHKRWGSEMVLDPRDRGGPSRFRAFDLERHQVVLRVPATNATAVARGPGLAVEANLQGYPKDGVWPTVFSPDGRIVAAGFPGLIVCWDSRTGKRLRAFSHGAEDDAVQLAVDPSRDRLVSIGRGGTALVWQLSKSQIVER